MRCRACQKHLSSWLDGELGGALASEVAAHLQGCPTCSAESRRLQTALGLIDGLPDPVPSTGFEAAFQKKLGEARIAAAARGRRPASRPAVWWRLPALGGVSAALIAAVVIGVMRPGTRTLPAPGSSEVELARHLDLLRDYEVVSNLDALENFEVVKDLDSLLEESR